jgi:uncharacterized protein (UPF0371 family)
LQNKLTDLNNHLFAQLERLSDEELSGEKLAEEIQRGKAITGIASQIIANGNMVLNSIRLQAEYTRDVPALPEFFGDNPVPEKQQKKIPDKLKAEFEQE